MSPDAIRQVTTLPSAFDLRPPCVTHIWACFAPYQTEKPKANYKSIKWPPFLGTLMKSLEAAEQLLVLHLFDRRPPSVPKAFFSFRHKMGTPIEYP